MQNVYGMSTVVAINRFPTDTEAELKFIEDKCKEIGVNVKLTEVWGKGGRRRRGSGGRSRASHRRKDKSDFTFSYDDSLSIREKIEAIAKKIYGADGVDFIGKSCGGNRHDRISQFRNLPVCIAKTQYSLSDDAKKLGRPSGFRISIRSAKVSAGAGFVVALAGDITDYAGSAEDSGCGEYRRGQYRKDQRIILTGREILREKTIMLNRTCREFIDVLASREPVPGGGGASALAGAVRIALGAMVGELTVGKKNTPSMRRKFQT